MSLLTSIIIFNFLPGETSAEESINLTAPSALLMEPVSGTVIFEKNNREIRACASITKVMTLLLTSTGCGSGCPQYGRGAQCQRSCAGSTDWVLTTDVEVARAALTELGAKHIVELPVDEVVRCQFGDLAVLSTPW